MRTVICVCVGAVLTTELLSVNITIRAVQRSSRGGRQGGLGREKKEMEKRRVRDRGKAFCMHCCSLGLAGSSRTRLYEGSQNRSIVIIHGPAQCVGRKKSFPGIKEILAAWLIKVEGEERGRRNRRREEEEEGDEGRGGRQPEEVSEECK